jgi:nitrite reductase/ring-hydroxylating ferredoxin subunit
MAAVKVAELSDVPPGTLKHVEVVGVEIVLANVNGTIYALADRCAHMNAPLSMGKLDGTQIICPLHYSRFNVMTGQKISGPVMGGLPGAEKLPPESQKIMARMGEIMAPVKTHDQKIYPVTVKEETILVHL